MLLDLNVTSVFPAEEVKCLFYGLGKFLDKNFWKTFALKQFVEENC